MYNAHCHGREEWMTIRDGPITISDFDEKGIPVLLIPATEKHEDDYVVDDVILTENCKTSVILSQYVFKSAVPCKI